MTPTRRDFLYKTGLLVGAFSAKSLFARSCAPNFEAAAGRILHLTPEEAAENEDY